MRLIRAGHIQHVDPKSPRLRWTQFEVLPGQSQDIEDVVFKDFQLIANAVSTHGEAALKAANARTSGKRAKKSAASREKVLQIVRPTVVFECNPSMTPMSITRNNTSKPDSYARLTPGTPLALPPRLGKSIYWDDIVVPGEFKKQDSSTDIHDVSAITFAFAGHLINDL